MGPGEDPAPACAFHSLSLLGPPAAVHEMAWEYFLPDSGVAGLCGPALHFTKIREGP